MGGRLGVRDFVRIDIDLFLLTGKVLVQTADVKAAILLGVNPGLRLVQFWLGTPECVRVPLRRGFPGFR